MDHGTGNMLPPQLTRIEWRSCLRVVPVALAAAVAVMADGYPWPRASQMPPSRRNGLAPNR